jgi:hypothetical protein
LLSVLHRPSECDAIFDATSGYSGGLLTPRADDAAAPMPRTLAPLLAGAVAIALNIAALAAADLVPLATAQGGLLRLLVVLSGDALPIPAGRAFQAGFHIVVGLAMALLYALVLEPVLPGPSWLRGLIYAVAVWLAGDGRGLRWKATI